MPTEVKAREWGYSRFSKWRAQFTNVPTYKTAVYEWCFGPGCSCGWPLVQGISFVTDPVTSEHQSGWVCSRCMTFRLYLTSDPLPIEHHTWRKP